MSKNRRIEQSVERIWSSLYQRILPLVERIAALMEQVSDAITFLAEKGDYKQKSRDVYVGEQAQRTQEVLERAASPQIREEVARKIKEQAKAAIPDITGEQVDPESVEFAQQQKRQAALAAYYQKTGKMPRMGEAGLSDIEKSDIAPEFKDALRGKHTLFGKTNIGPQSDEVLDLLGKIADGIIEQKRLTQEANADRKALSKAPTGPTTGRGGHDDAAGRTTSRNAAKRRQ